MQPNFYDIKSCPIKDYPKRYSDVDLNSGRFELRERELRLTRPYINKPHQKGYMGKENTGEERDLQDWIRDYDAVCREVDDDLWKYALKKTWLEAKLAYPMYFKLVFLSQKQAFRTRIKRELDHKFVYRPSYSTVPDAEYVLRRYWFDIIDSTKFHNTDEVIKLDSIPLPFPGCSFIHMKLVKDMDERIGLLEHASKRKMIYGDFLNYVVNYACSVNDELGYQKYVISRATANTFYSIRKSENPEYKSEMADIALYDVFNPDIDTRLDEVVNGKYGKV
ncbi:MAG: hypothetical protein WC455_10655 [Dehalococcoidia bacterium]|jgi:hypothetical protein